MTTNKTCDICDYVDDTKHGIAVFDDNDSGILRCAVCRQKRDNPGKRVFVPYRVNTIRGKGQGKIDK